jgi:phage protein U
MAAKIGSYGNIAFVVTPEVIRTFRELTRSSASRWADHEIMLKKPKSQFLGPGLDTVTFTMYFAAWHGTNPRKEMEKLVEWDRKGKAGALTIGGKKLGVGLWVITGLEQAWSYVDNRGNLLAGTINITLKEYVK